MSLISHIGKSHGSTKDKFNRAQRLIDNWAWLEDKMIRYIQAGNGQSERARCAYGILLMMQTGIRIGNESSADGYKSVKTEFVIVGGKYVPVRKHNSNGEYIVQPHLAHLPRYININKKMILTSQYSHPIVNTYGLTTLLPQHVDVKNNTLHIVFVGKKQVQQHLTTQHPILVKYAQLACDSHQQSTWLGIDYITLRAFVKKSIGNIYKPKDIRTAIVNIQLINNINNISSIRYNTKKNGIQHVSTSTMTRKGDVNKFLSTYLETTAKQIGHTKGACKTSYVSPQVLSKAKEKLISIYLKNKEKSK